MANKKFSEFTSQTDSANVQFVVGYNGSDNVRISPGNLLGAYLPLAGGTMTGDLGIGGAPSHPLDVKGADTNNATIARFYSNTGTRGSFGIKNGVSVSPSIFIGTLGGSEQLAIGVNSTESIRINGSGNVGINATSPSEKLHVDGNIRVNSGTQGIYSSFIQAISSTGLKIGNDDFSGYAFFHNDGNTGIGTVTPTAKLQVVGLAEYADNSAATTAGLTAGAFYRTGDLLKVVH